MEKRACHECGEKINGRIDKKFCSDMCRNAFNNKQNSDTNNYMRNINNMLRKNRRILEETLQGEKTTVPKSRLLQQGFDFTLITNQVTTRNNHTYNFCYEYGYLPLEKELYLIVRRHPDQPEKREH